MIKIIRAKTMGFCFGVKRAVEMAESHPGRLNTLGPLIHNPQEVNRLAQLGKTPIDDLSQASEKIILIRAHGLPDFIIKRAIKLGLKVVDATCPFVKKAQALSQRLEKDGYQVVIIGEKIHPEIIGLVGNLKNPIVVETLEEAKSLGQFKKLGVIAQTTSNTRLVEEISVELKKHAPEVKIAETICQATEEHQQAARELAPRVDVMIVVGGKSSGNTRRLYQICIEYVPAYHIETARELKPEWFKNIKSAGITAGASTPDWVISEVEKTISGI
ncbi:MAG: 4-hydroxy-3-methylbut-2-enyl diphosphate reductase [Patescibacteria group bacterium]|nr:4-hydroxy-3-methylbut-2-enyl diphosphate reductase [Patescibacteria group bacterium]